MPDLDDKRKQLEAISREIEAIEEDLAQLRNSYEQYFLGLERKPPTREHDTLKRRVAKLKNQFFIRGTALKFKVQSLEQKYQSYDRLWIRTLTEIENGTYHRDLSKVRRKAEAEKAKAAAPQAPPPDAQPAAPGQAAAQAAPGARPTSSPAIPAIAKKPISAAPGNLSDDKLRAVYDAYVHAKQKCQEDVSKINYDTIAATLRKQVPELLKKHNAKEIDFKVVIKDGKAVLRAVPK